MCVFGKEEQSQRDRGAAKAIWRILERYGVEECKKVSKVSKKSSNTTSESDFARSMMATNSLTLLSWSEISSSLESQYAECSDQ